MNIKRIGALLIVLTVLLVAVSPVASVSGANFTTINTKVDGKGHCKNSEINCNIYDGKEYVWLNGGPTANGLGPDGDYFFAVLVPGGQPDPNDGGAKNLSDDYDLYTDRTFTVTDGEVSGYDGPHDLDSGKSGKKGEPNGAPPYIRLFPYADTWNPGGVYILAICSLEDGYPVVPRACKYDAFKVQKGKARFQFFLSGYKYRDDIINGQWDEVEGEPGLEGWEITISGADPFGEVINETVTTDTDGYWEWESPLYSYRNKDNPSDISLTVCEALQDHWRQTGNTVDQSIVAGDVTVTLREDKCYDVVVAMDGIASADMLNFGNVPECDISGGKYYDTDENGQYDDGEPWLEGWEITYDGASVFTGADGTFMLTVDPGSYTFAEVQGHNDGIDGWFQTGNTVDQTVTTGGAQVSLFNFVYMIDVPIDQPSSVDGLYFGNVCRIAPGGRTPGFWQNNNGQELIDEADLEALRDLNLVDEDGNDFDPWTPEDVGNWILSDAGQNMAWKLSSFVAAVTLNTLNAFEGADPITDPDVLVPYDGGWVTVGELLVIADDLLGQYPLTPPDAAGRAEQTVVKNILDGVANNHNFIQPPPGDGCGDPYPTP
jgi:hypothetical protein